MRPKILNGDCRIHLKEIKDIDLVITSPPYWGLRDYGEDTKTIWGGAEDCEHEWELVTRKGMSGGVSGIELTRPNSLLKRRFEETKVGYCQCGAWYGQLGLEPTWQEYVKHLVEISKEIKRVLKKTGSYYLVLGDTYFGGSGGREKGISFQSEDGWEREGRITRSDEAADSIDKPKQKLLIPYRVAIALQEDGWICRNDITWHKPNAMPSSVKDRLTIVTERVFHLVKSRRYYYDLDKIREPHSDGPWGKQGKVNTTIYPRRFNELNNPKGKNLGDVYKGKFTAMAEHEDYGSPRARTQRKINETSKSFIERGSGGNINLPQPEHPLGKNPGDFWEINTQPYPEAHFAVFPEELVERIIKSSCPPDGTVLDPFCGSGTTLRVAMDMGIKSIGIDISKKYIELSKKRCGLEYDITLLNKYLKPLESWS